MKFKAMLILIFLVPAAHSAPNFGSTDRALQTLWPEASEVEREALATSVALRTIGSGAWTDEAIAKDAVAAARLFTKVAQNRGTPEDARAFMALLVEGLNRSSLVETTRRERIDAGDTIALSSLLGAAGGAYAAQYASMIWDVLVNGPYGTTGSVMGEVPVMIALGVTVLAVLNIGYSSLLKARSNDRLFVPGSATLAKSLKSRRVNRLFIKTFARELQKDSKTEVPLDPDLLFVHLKRTWQSASISSACGDLLARPALAIADDSDRG